MSTYIVGTYDAGKPYNKFRPASDYAQDCTFSDRAKAVEHATRMAQRAARDFRVGDKPPAVWAVEESPSRRIVWQHPGVETLMPAEYTVTWIDAAGAHVTGPRGKVVIAWDTLRQAAKQPEPELAALYSRLSKDAERRMFTETRPTEICGWRNVGNNTYHLLGRGIDGGYHAVREWDRSLLRLTVDDGQTYYSWAEVDKLGRECAERNGLVYSRNTRDVL